MSQMPEGTCETKSFFDQRSRQNPDRRHLVGMPPAVHSEADRPIRTPGAAHKAKWTIRPEREQNVRRSGMVGEHQMAGKAARRNAIGRAIRTEPPIWRSKSCGSHSNASPTMQNATTEEPRWRIGGASPISFTISALPLQTKLICLLL